MKKFVLTSGLMGFKKDRKLSPVRPAMVEVNTPILRSINVKTILNYGH
jgi:hypothetical protein